MNDSELFKKYTRIKYMRLSMYNDACLNPEYLSDYSEDIQGEDFFMTPKEFYYVHKNYAKLYKLYGDFENEVLRYVSMVEMLCVDKIREKTYGSD